MVQGEPQSESQAAAADQTQIPAGLGAVPPQGLRHAVLLQQLHTVGTQTSQPSPTTVNTRRPQQSRLSALAPAFVPRAHFGNAPSEGRSLSIPFQYDQNVSRAETGFSIHQSMPFRHQMPTHHMTSHNQASTSSTRGPVLAGARTPAPWFPSPGAPPQMLDQAALTFPSDTWTMDPFLSELLPPTAYRHERPPSVATATFQDPCFNNSPSFPNYDDESSQGRAWTQKFLPERHTAEMAEENGYEGSLPAVAAAFVSRPSRGRGWGSPGGRGRWGDREGGRQGDFER